MLLPKKVKYRKWQRARKDMDSLTPDTRGITLSFGSFGLKALAAAQIKSNQLESARKAMTRALGKGGRVWIRIFPDRPITAKPAEVGMGKGKGIYRDIVSKFAQEELFSKSMVLMQLLPKRPSVRLGPSYQ